MGELLAVDFGKQARESARTFARLMGLAEELPTDILANPEKHLVAASAEIRRLRKIIEDARDSLRRPISLRAWTEGPVQFHPLSTVMVDRDEFARLRQMEARIRDADTFGEHAP